MLRTTTNVRKTNLSKMILLSDGHNLSNHHTQVESLLQTHPIFSQLWILEQRFSPVLEKIEKNGLVVLSDWFSNGLVSERIKLVNIKTELVKYIGEFGNDSLKKQFSNYCIHHSLYVPPMNELRSYHNLHPVYQLVDDYNKTLQYLKLWDTRLVECGVRTPKGHVQIRGVWQSFSSFTGRVTAKKLPLTSLPKTMRQYITDINHDDLISIDIHAAELRFLSHWSSDPELNKCFSTGKDPFSRVVSNLMLDKELSENLARTLVKQVIYGLMYGASYQTLYKNARKKHKKLSSNLFSDLINSIQNQFSVAIEYLDNREAAQNIETVFGQMNPEAIFSGTQKRNFTLQHSVAVALKLLAIQLDSSGFRVVHVLHDEVWISKPSDFNNEKLKEVLYLYKETLKQYFPNLNTTALLTINNMKGLASTESSSW